MDELIDELREANQPVPIPLELPEEDDLVEVQEALFFQSKTWALVSESEPWPQDRELQESVLDQAQKVLVGEKAALMLPRVAEPMVLLTPDLPERPGDPCEQP